MIQATEFKFTHFSNPSEADKMGLTSIEQAPAGGV